MPASDYIASIRRRIGHDLLLLPGVTAVIRHGERFLLARHAHSGLWSLIGGAVEPGEEPAAAVRREVAEETGATIRATAIVGVFGGEPMMVEYPNGDRVGYVTTAYECELLSEAEPDGEEIVEIGWFERSEIASLPRRQWIDRVIADTTSREVVCICGSTRFVEEMRAANRELSLSGAVVLAPAEMNGPVTDDQKGALDALHRRKIEMADRILVVNPGGHLVESTRAEIAYARRLGTPVSFTVPV